MPHKIALPLLLLVLLGAQTVFWQYTHEIHPSLEIVPPPPSAAAVNALSLGDTQFYFRALAFEMQSFGDSYGRMTPLRMYDYCRLYFWFTLLDGLDPRSDLLAMLAANYFSMTQNTPDVRYMVDFLYTHAMRDVPHKWWWLLQGIYLADYRLKDSALAIKLAQPMLNPKVPAWAQQIVAIEHEKRGEMEQAYQIMMDIRAHAEEFTDRDFAYMKYFIKERLKKLDELRGSE